MHDQNKTTTVAVLDTAWTGKAIKMLATTALRHAESAQKVVKLCPVQYVPTSYIRSKRENRQGSMAVTH